MHTLYFSTPALIGHRNGGQQHGLIWLCGVPATAAPEAEWGALLADTAEAETATWLARRTSEAVADLDYLRGQAARPGPDEEVIVLTLPAQTSDQDETSASVKAFFTQANRPEGIVLTTVLVRRGDLRHLAIDLDLERLVPRMEEVQTALAQQPCTDLAARRRLVSRVTGSILFALKQLEAPPLGG